MPVSFGQNAVADTVRSFENLLTAKIRVNIAGLPLPAADPSVPSAGLPYPGGPKWERAAAIETATRSHPVVRRNMADPNFARLAHDDVQPLTGLERAVRLAFPAYDDDTLWNNAGHLIPFNGLVNLAQSVAGNRQGDTQNSYVGHEADGIGRFVSGLGELADVYGRYRRDMAAAGFANFGPRDPNAYDATAGTRAVAALANALKARGQNLKAQVSKATPVTKAGGLAGNVVPGAVAAVVPGGQAVAATYFAGQGADDVAQKARQAGTYGTPAADTAIAGNAMFQGGMSAIPIERFAAPLVPVMGGPIKQWLAAGAVKTGLATAQAAAMTMGQNGLVKTMVDPKQDLLGGEGESVGDMAFLTLLSHLLHGSVSPAARQAAGTRARVNAVAENARASTLRTRAPEVFRRVVKSAAGNGPAKTVYIRPKPFVEAMQSPKGDSVLQAMPELADKTREALANNSHIAIPVEDLAAHIGPSDVWDGVADHLTLSPDHMSIAEVRDDAVGAAKAIQAEYAAAQAGAGNAAEFNRSTQAVIGAVHDRLNAASPFSAQDNAVRAHLAGQIYAVQASREGRTPVDLYRRGPPSEQSNSALPDSEDARSVRPNLMYRALTKADVASLSAGLGLQAKAPDGKWTAAEHVANYGEGTAGGAAENSPWISTSRNPSVARAYDSGNGVVAIDLDKVSSPQVEVWKNEPRPESIRGPKDLAYHRSIWAQEVTVLKSIPHEAIIGISP